MTIPNCPTQASASLDTTSSYSTCHCCSRTHPLLLRGHALRARPRLAREETPGGDAPVPPVLGSASPTPHLLAPSIPLRASRYLHGSHTDPLLSASASASASASTSASVSTCASASASTSASTTTDARSRRCGQRACGRLLPRPRAPRPLGWRPRWLLCRRPRRILS